MTTKCELFWNDGEGAFPESHAIAHTLALNSTGQPVRFTFPALDRPIAALRFDFADTPASVKVEGIALKDGADTVCWQWDGDPAVFHELQEAQATRVEGEGAAVMLASSGLDPRCLLAVPPDVLSQAQAGWYVEMALVPQADPEHDFKKGGLQRDLAINSLLKVVQSQKKHLDQLILEHHAQRQLNERFAAENQALKQQVEQLASDCRMQSMSIARYEENDVIIRKRLNEHEGVLKSITSSKWLRRLFPISDLPNR